MLIPITDSIQKIVITFPQGMGSVNSYLMKGSKGYTIIDTGMNHREAKEIWKSFLSQGEKIEKVVLTHVHEDHVGLAKWFQEKIGIPVYVSDIGYQEMKKNLNRSMEDIQRLIQNHGGPEIPKTFRWDLSIYDFEPDGIFAEGDVIRLGDDEFQAIWTPGHAPDQFCFYAKEEKLMIVGDHILKDIAPVIGLWNGKEANPLQEYLTSLQKIKPYSANLALPGHGETIDQLYDRILELEKRHQWRLEQVDQLLKGEPKTAYEICADIYGEVDILTHISTFMATLTRLIYLETLGKIYRIDKDGVTLFHQH